MKRPQILVVCAFFPLPLDHGDAIRRYRLLASLHEFADVHLFTVKRPTTTEEDVQHLRNALHPDVISVFEPSIDAEGGLASRVRRVWTGFVRRAPSWMFSEWSRSLEDGLAAAVEKAGLVLVVGEASAINRLPRLEVPLIWDKSNVLTASLLESLRSPASVAAKAKAAFYLLPSYLLERRIIRRSARVWVTSEIERGRLHKVFGEQDTAIIPSVVDVVAAPVARSGVRDFVWMSTFPYRPNWDGLIRMLDAFRADPVEGFRLRVIGSGASVRQIAKLAEYGFVDYLGFQADLAEAASGASGALVPIWSGAGVKLKTLTLMALGLPIIGTPAALEGIDVRSAAAVVDNPEDFPRSLRELTEETLRHAREAGLKAVQRDHSPANFTERLKAGLAGLEAQG